MPSPSSSSSTLLSRALVDAARGGDFEGARQLLDDGADVFWRNPSDPKMNNSAFFAAALKANEEPWKKIFWLFLEKMDPQRFAEAQTPGEHANFILAAAASADMPALDAVVELSQKHCLPSTVALCARRGLRRLIPAVNRDEHALAAARLISLFDLVGQNQPEETAALLTACVREKRAPILRALLSAGASPNQKNQWGSSPLGEAISHHFAGPDWKSFAEILLPTADREDRNKSGKSLLHLAVAADSVDDITAWAAEFRRLLPFCDIAAADNDGKTILHEAIEWLNGNGVAALMPFVPLHVALQKNKEGRDPIEEAFFECMWDAVDALPPLWPLEQIKTLINASEAFPGDLGEMPKLRARLEAEEIASVLEDAQSRAGDGLAAPARPNQRSTRL